MGPRVSVMAPPSGSWPAGGLGLEPLCFELVPIPYLCGAAPVLELMGVWGECAASDAVEDCLSADA